jgi:hypothetical protein
VVRQPARHAALPGDNIDVEVPLVLASEGDLRAVWREDGVRFQPNAAGEAGRVAAVAADQPQVAGVDKSDMCFTDGGSLQEQRCIISASAGSSHEQSRPAYEDNLYGTHQFSLAEHCRLLEKCICTTPARQYLFWAGVAWPEIINETA